MKIRRQHCIYCDPGTWEKIRRRARKARMPVSRFGVLCCLKAGEEGRTGPAEPSGQALAITQGQQRRLYEDIEAVWRAGHIMLDGEETAGIGVLTSDVIRFLRLTDGEDCTMSNDRAKGGRGERAISPATMANRRRAARFDGLPAGVGKRDLLDAIRDGGRECGLSRTEMHRLVYLVEKTEEIDWRGEASLPVVWTSVSRMAFELGVGRGRINAVERSLADKGWIVHRDTGERRRWGERDPETGRVTEAYGVDLRMLGSRYEELGAAAVAKEDAWRMRESVRAEASSLHNEVRQLAAALGRESGLGRRAGDTARALEDLIAERDRLQVRRDALAAELLGHGDDPQRSIER